MSIDSSLGRVLVAAAEVMGDIQHASTIQPAGKGPSAAEAANLKIAETLAYKERLASSVAQVSKAAHLLELVVRLGDGAASPDPARKAVKNSAPAWRPTLKISPLLLCWH